MFNCSSCAITFSYKASWKRHMKAKHPETIVNTKDNTKQQEVHVFHSDEEFTTWKSEIERQTCSSFIIASGGNKNEHGSLVKYYQCHRSGPPIIRNTRKRRLKVNGSIKIGIRCPAGMKVEKTTIQEAVEIVVTFTPTHVGHDSDPRAIKLSTTEKDLLAGYLKAGISRKRILQTLREQFKPPQRLSYTTNKDLHNIFASYNIKNVCLSSKDITTTLQKCEEITKILSVRPTSCQKMESNESADEYCDFTNSCQGSDEEVTDFPKIVSVTSCPNTDHDYCNFTLATNCCQENDSEKMELLLKKERPPTLESKKDKFLAMLHGCISTVRDIRSHETFEQSVLGLISDLYSFTSAQKPPEQSSNNIYQNIYIYQPIQTFQ